MRISVKLLSSHYYDVIVVGGGMVGSAMVCSLRADPFVSSKSILLLEAGKPKLPDKMSEPRSYSNRVSAISPASRKFFENIGVWNYLATNACPKVVKQLRVWDACSESKINFEHANFDHDVAYVMENSKIIDACLDKLAGPQKNLTIKHESKIHKIELPSDAHKLVNVVLSDGSKMTSSLVIGADGHNSFVRSSIGAHYLSWSYDQKAIVGTVDIKSVGENTVAWQRFTPTGPVALLPLTDKQSSLVWTTSDEEAGRLMSLPDDQFVDELNNILWREDHRNLLTNRALAWFDACIDATNSGPTHVNQLPPTVLDMKQHSRACFPLGFGHSTSYVRNRSVLIGDAAHRIHPLAGLGVNLGFGDCSALTQILQEAIKNGADIGSALYLQDYQSKRQLKNLPVMFAMDFLNRLYRTDFTPLVLARSLGLSATNYSTFIKMCVTFLWINSDFKEGDDSDWQLILINNRDEDYYRPTQSLAWHGDVLCSCDMEPGKEGGTWLGMNRFGKLAFIHNVNYPVRENACNLLGRGMLVKNFLADRQKDATHFATEIHQRGDMYNGLTIGYINRDDAGWKNVLYSNTDKDALLHINRSGFYGYGNCPPNEGAFEKVKKGLKTFESICLNWKNHLKIDVLIDDLLSVLTDTEQCYPDDLMKKYQPSLSNDLVRRMTSCFVEFPAENNYGTRTNTIILLDGKNKASYFERNLEDPVKNMWSTKRVEFTLEEPS